MSDETKSKIKSATLALVAAVGGALASMGYIDCPECDTCPEVVVEAAPVEAPPAEAAQPEE